MVDIEQVKKELASPLHTKLCVPIVRPHDIPSVYNWLRTVDYNAVRNRIESIKELPPSIKSFIVGKRILSVCFWYSHLGFDSQSVQQVGDGLMVYALVSYMFQFRKFFPTCLDQRMSAARDRLKSSSLFSMFESHYDLVHYIVQRNTPSTLSGLDSLDLYRRYVRTVNAIRQSLRALATAYYK